MILYPLPQKITKYDKQTKLKNSFFVSNSLQKNTEMEYVLRRIPQSTDKENSISLSFFEKSTYGKEEYLLEINEEICIFAGSPQGANYAVTTLLQIISQSSGELPFMTVHDFPDFENRGIMLDVSRCKIPKISEIKRLIDLMESLKYNQLQLYFEGFPYAYKGFESYWEDKNPLTPDDIKEIDTYCTEHFICLVPNQNSFGHMHQWLAKKELKSLAECEEGYDYTDENDYSRHCSPATLNPLDIESIKFVDKLYDCLLPSFSGTALNVGLDETFELGLGKSKALVEKKGKEKVYLDFLLEIYRLCKKHNRQMMFWADMLINSPESLNELPKDVIPIEWGYEDNHEFAKNCEMLYNARLKFYVAPGTSSWGSFTGRSDNMRQNLLNAAVSGKKFGASGYLLTDWGDGGHMQFPLISYVPYAYGAGLSWNTDGNKKIEATFEFLDFFVFNVSENQFSKIIYESGNYYKLEAYKRFNSTAVSSIMCTDLNDNRLIKEQSEENFSNILTFVKSMKEKLGRCNIVSDEHKMYVAELNANLDMVEVFSRIGTIKLSEANKSEIENVISQIVKLSCEFERLWLIRNREYNAQRFIETLNKYTAQLSERL